MLSADEIRRSLIASVLFLRGKEEGLDLLDRSIAGFWRSFAVIVLILPINAITMLAVSRTDDTDRSVAGLIVDGLPVLLLDWIAFPIALALGARVLGVTATYVDYVVARNWAAPLAAAIMTVPFVLQGAGWTNPSLTAFLSILTLGIVLRLHFIIIRAALKTEIAPSIGLVIVDILITLLIVGLVG